MNVLRDILAELVSMFVADRRLALGLLFVVGLARAAMALAEPLLSGGILVLGCVGLLIDSVMRTAKGKTD